MPASLKSPPLIPDCLAQYHPPAPPEKSASGSPVRKFAAPVTLWVAELTGYTAHAEAQTGGALRAQYTARFLTRWRPDLDSRGRIEVAGRFYELTAIAPAPYGGRRSWLLLHATEAVK